jgi:DNA-directed RNA polymerase subunit M/transcription elongation factor TFIIS
MGEFVSVIFCRICNSRYVDVSEWTSGENPVFRCRTCGYTEEIKGFNLGRSNVTRVELQNARDTLAKKNRYER